MTILGFSDDWVAETLVRSDLTHTGGDLCDMDPGSTSDDDRTVHSDMLNRVVSRSISVCLV